MSLRCMDIRYVFLAACLLAPVACDPPTVVQPASTQGGGTVSVVYNYPHNGQGTPVPAETPIVVIFSEDIDPKTLDGNLVVEKGKGNVVKGTVTYEAADMQATVTPPGGQWDTGADYTVTVKTGIKSKDGSKSLDKEYSFVFITK